MAKTLVGQVSDVKTSPDISLGRTAAATVAKVAWERVLAQYPRRNGKPLVGNATFKSGLIKLLGAGGAYWAHKKTSGAVKTISGIHATAWTFDGVEDMVAAGIRQFVPQLRANSQKAQVKAL